MRRQIRRLQQITVAGTLATLAASAVLLTTPEVLWLRVLLLLALVGYLHRKLRQIYWAHRAVKQLRLEEHFVRHGPTPEEVLTCVRRRNHLWTQSLTLKALKSLLAPASEEALRVGEKGKHVRRQYRRSFGALCPSRVPVDLVWCVGLLLLWLWSAPQALPQAMSPLLALGAAAMLVLLLTEVVQTVLRADLRDGFEAFTTLLSDWTLARRFEETLQAARQKHYRHTPLYRAALPALAALAAKNLEEVT